MITPYALYLLLLPVKWGQSLLKDQIDKVNKMKFVSTAKVHQTLYSRILQMLLIKMLKL